MGFSDPAQIDTDLKDFFGECISNYRDQKKAKRRKPMGFFDLLDFIGFHENRKILSHWEADMVFFIKFIWSQTPGPLLSRVYDKSMGNSKVRSKKFVSFFVTPTRVYPELEIRLAQNEIKKKKKDRIAYGFSALLIDRSIR